MILLIFFVLVLYLLLILFFVNSYWFFYVFLETAADDIIRESLDAVNLEYGAAGTSDKSGDAIFDGSSSRPSTGMPSGAPVFDDTPVAIRANDCSSRILVGDVSTGPIFDASGQR